MTTLTPGQLWLTERSKVKTSRLMPKEIREYVSVGGKVIEWKEVFTGPIGNRVVKIQYITETFADGLSCNLDARTINAIINDGGLFPDGGMTEDGMTILVK